MWVASGDHRGFSCTVLEVRSSEGVAVVRLKPSDADVAVAVEDLAEEWEREEARGKDDGRSHGSSREHTRGRDRNSGEERKEGRPKEKERDRYKERDRDHRRREHDHDR
jgi:hypothetical protein